MNRLNSKLHTAANQNVKEREYWLKQLAGDWEKSQFPPDPDRHGKKIPLHSFMESLSFEFPAKINTQLTAVIKENNYVLHIYMTAVLALLLHKTTSAHKADSDFTLATPIYKQDIEKDFINRVLVIKVKTGNAMTFKELLKQVKQTIVAAIENQNYPLVVLAEQLGRPAAGDEFPLFDTAVLITNIHDKTYLRHLNHNLTFSFTNKDRQIKGEIEYNANRWGKPFIQRISRCFLYLLGSALDHPEEKLSHLEILSKEEKKQVLVTFNTPQTGSPGIDPRPIHQLFTEQALRTPNRTAVTVGVDMDDIYPHLESGQAAGKIPLPSIHKYENCCFQKNLYLFTTDLEPSDPGNTGKIVKTHRHNSLIMDHHTFKLLDLFTGEKNLKTLFNQLKHLELKFSMYLLTPGDVLEISYEIENKIEIALQGEIQNFIQLVNVFYRNHLVRLKSVTNTSLPNDMEISPGNYFKIDESVDDRLHPEEILKSGSQLSKARVLLLGDTPGTAGTGLLYLASYLRRNGIPARCRFFDPDREYAAMKKNIETLLHKIQPEIVAVSMKWFLHIARTLEICKIVKTLCPGIKIVVGGNTAAYYPEEIIREENIDYLVCGDGEVPLLEICQGKPIISNCLYKKNGRIIRSPITYKEETNPTEIYLSHLDEILLSPRAPIFGSFFIYTHKGCGMNCLYCGGSNKAHRKAFNRDKLYRRGIEEVRKDILAAKPFTSTFFFDFDIPDKNLLEYCKQTWAGIDLSSHFCILGNLVPPSAGLVEFVNHTFKYVYWNLDMASLSERHRQELSAKNLVKPQPFDKEIIGFFNECQKYPNAEIRINLIAGLPLFTSEDIQKSEEMLDYLMRTYPCLSELHWARLHAQPGAPIIENAHHYHMHSYAVTYTDFLEYSRKNFRTDTPYPGVEYFDYPYIYYNDDTLNSKISKHYQDMNLKIEEYKETRQKSRQFYQHLTYRQLDNASHALSLQLRAKGVKPGTIVGLELDPSLEMAVGILGILKAGGAYLPIEPGYPGKQIDYMLKDSNARILLTSHEIAPLSSPQASLNLSEGRNFTNDQCPMTNDQLAYLIYTSGTTGTPKGVLVNHRGLVNYTLWRLSSYNLTGHDITLQLISFSFDGFGSNFYSALLSGGELVLVPGSKRTDMDYIKETVKNRKITNLSIVPGIYEALLERAQQEEFNSLEFVVLAGEKAGTHLIRASRERYPHIRLVNEYGPTEATVTAAAKIGIQAGSAAVIGTPIANTCIYILDCRLQPVPIGIFGEIYISGPGVASGYLNQPELTSEKFKRTVISHSSLVIRKPGRTVISHSSLVIRKPGRTVISHSSLVIGSSSQFSPNDRSPKALPNDQCPMTNDRSPKLLPNDQCPMTNDRSFKFFRTGDLARWQSDGNIEFSGRIDRQVKIRGFRIEPGEIEARLLRHPSVKEVVVTGRQDKAGNKYLCAYVVSPGILTPETPGLKDYLARELPIHMIPAHFVRVEAIPRTSSGKVDRKRLYELEDAVPVSTFTVPRDLVEKKLAVLWSEVLQLQKPISIDDNFFDLGGHSLKTTVLISKIHKELQVKIPQVEIFKLPTIRQLSQYIKQAVPHAYISINPGEEKEYYPLSYNQKRLWIMQRLNPAGTTYHVSGSIQFKHKPALEIIKAIFTRLANRHQSLRTRFAEIKGEPVQIIEKSVTISLEIHDISSISGEEKEQRQEQIFTPKQRKLFDLGKAPLFRAAVFKLHDNHYELLFRMHHIICDGWSMEILKQEFNRLYDSHLRGKEEKPGPVYLQYKDFTRWQQEQLTSPSGREKALDYWRKLFNDGIPLLELPGDDIPITHGNKGCGYRSLVPPGTKDRLQKLAKHCSTSLFILLFTAYKILLSHLVNREEILCGIPAAGREHDSLQRIVGFILHMLLVKSRINPGENFIHLQERIKLSFLEALEHQSFPLELLLDDLKKEYPRIDAAFNMLNMQEATEAMELEDFTPQHTGDLPEVKFKMELYVIPYKNGIEIHWHLQKEIFKPGTIAYIAHQYIKLLEEIAQNPGKPLAEINLFRLNPALIKGNTVQPANEYQPFEKEDINRSIPQRFEEQVDKYPHRVAIKLGSRHWTYRELNRWVQGIARVLTGKYGNPCRGAALLFEHGAEMIAAMIGVLKSGNYYIPLDPTYPAKRLARMIKDSQAKILLTNSKNLEMAQCLAAGTNSKITIIDINTMTISRDSSAKNPSTEISPAQWAYILYTSGSTGEPKGVIQTHGNVLHFIRVYTNNLHIQPGDRLTLFSSYSFDAAVMDIYGALLNGASVFPYDLKQENQGGLESTADWLKREQITIYHSIPTLYRYFTAVLDPGETFPGIRLVVMGGEPVLKKDVENYKSHFPGTCLFINGLGPTESTVTLQYFIDQNTQITKATVPVGFPVENTHVYLIDKNRQEARVFGIGEIAYKSSHLALGYLNLPGKTADVFATDPITGNGRVYLSGDMGRRLPDGNIEYLGRKDHQVKVMGYRIELAEIESQIDKISGIEKNVVVCRQNQKGENFLAAFYTKEKNKDLRETQLAEILKETLPRHMIPNVFICLDRLPLTPSGKIDRESLPDVAYREKIKPFRPSRDNLEKQLTGIWYEVLFENQDQQVLSNRMQPGIHSLIGIEDNFFEIGGHSLKALILVSRIQQRLNLTLPLIEVYKSPYIKAQAEYLRWLTGKQRIATLEDDSMILIKPGKEQARHLFLIHDATGGLDGYIEFCSHLPREFNYWGIRRDGSTGIEVLARQYIKKIKQVQPQGPYFIAGWCLGGMIAFEIVNQLEQKAEPIGFLALIDPPGPRQKVFKGKQSSYIPQRQVKQPGYFFKASASKFKQRPWNPYCEKPFQYYKIAGDHRSIMQAPRVESLAKLFTNLLLKQ
jgi:amino acid adenylation domain-containing protein